MCGKRSEGKKSPTGQRAYKFHVENSRGGFGQLGKCRLFEFGGGLHWEKAGGGEKAFLIDLRGRPVRRLMGGGGSSQNIKPHLRGLGGRGGRSTAQ